MKQDVQINVSYGLSEKCTQFRASLLQWGRTHFREYPWRNPHTTPYEILIAELLLKRTTATAAARIYEDFLSRFPNITAILETKEENLIECLSTVGLQKQKAKAIKSLAEFISTKYQAMLPSSLDQLLIIPGLGPYSARAVLSFGFKIPTTIVDANVKRVFSRVFQKILPSKPNDQFVQQLADLLLDDEFHREYNYALLDFGALVCCYVSPLHNKCPLSMICDHNNQNNQILLQEKFKVKIGQKLRQIRNEKKISLVNLVKLAKLSKLTIINIESGKTTPKLITIKKIAQALNTDYRKL
jgi:A/G-specific adenine glycosylase